MTKAEQPDQLLCPCCGKRRSVAETKLLQAEADWLATGAFDIHRQPGWSVEAACAGKLQWACIPCFETGRAIEGHPALQTWCDDNPYFAFIDVERRCEDCGHPFMFSATEQQYWYETLKFWVQSRPKQCVSCRKARRAGGGRCDRNSHGVKTSPAKAVIRSGPAAVAPGLLAQLHLGTENDS